MTDQWNIKDTALTSRLFLGTATYPSPDALAKAIESAQPGMLTVSLRRENAAGKGQDFWNIIKGFNIPTFPNTAGCYGVKEAVTTAQMAREVFETEKVGAGLMCIKSIQKKSPRGRRTGSRGRSPEEQD